jgi:hypothetical protein
MTTTLERLRELAGIVESRPAYVAPVKETEDFGYLSEQRLVAEGFTAEEIAFLIRIPNLTVEEMVTEEAWLEEQKVPMGLHHTAHRREAGGHSKAARITYRALSIHPDDRAAASAKRNHSPDTRGSDVSLQHRGYRFRAIAAHHHRHAAKHLRGLLDDLKLPAHIKKALKAKERPQEDIRDALKVNHPGVAKLHALWRQQLKREAHNEGLAGHYTVHAKSGALMERPPKKAKVLPFPPKAPAIATPAKATEPAGA